MSKPSAKSGGIGFFGFLTIAFVILKLCGIIRWSWVLVLMPAWIPLGILMFILGVILVYERFG